jgi:hypothetical protein
MKREQWGSNNPNWKGGITGTAEYYRDNKARYRLRHRDKHLAHKAVQTAISRGKIQRSRCEICGSKDSHAHHDDYSKPLSIRWFCKKHHEAHHREMHQPE